MQTRNRILDDLAKVAGGAVSTLAGIKGEVDTLIRQQLERLMAQMDAVPRDEFEAVKAVASKARAEQEKLEIRLTRIEARLAKGAPLKTARKAGKTASTKGKAAAGKKPAAKTAPKRKAAAKTTP
ncbi:MAG: accessory factor UbiK family protein [Proteobacteria bacterium]|nr:accessory factor UbiK family protein [Pseudomonadota bacterium]